MKVEKKITLVYTTMGVFLGLLTAYLLKINANLVVALALPVVVYFLSFLVLGFLVRQKKILLLYNSFVTFILIWLTVWILVYSMW